MNYLQPSGKGPYPTWCLFCSLRRASVEDDLVKYQASAFCSIWLIWLPDQCIGLMSAYIYNDVYVFMYTWTESNTKFRNCTR